jgi:ADP-heptose:LPS heptosyltransferase
MGDTLWGTPAIRAIKKALPQVGVDLILQPQWSDLFFGNKNIRRIISYNSQWYRQIIGLPTMLQSRYDHILIFHANRNISRILPWLRCKSILSHQYPDSIPGIPNKKIVRFEKPVHGILRRLGLLEEIQIPSNGTHMDLFLNDNDQAEAFLFLKKNHMTPKEFIYINAGGSSPYKQWPVDKFISLTKLIQQNTPLTIVLGGGPEAADRVVSIEKQLDKQRVTRATHLPLGINCALIAQARILISPDSGPMHIGFALKVPTISLFWSTNSQNIIRNELNGSKYCGPLEIDKSLSTVLYGNFKGEKKGYGPEHFHLNPILVSEVWEKVLNFLNMRK